ncbi:ribosomal RNA-processing protein 8-like [Branchiostoma floridae]|uniref:Ribosomal RNA-processing protein 8 n=1 Tax=Branchiostoma floridae TaxID=7739 RepID=A0A9J7LFI9_BRAFL|nr:ribosomal RNA-processing protein 8-like [Branchiostoma floridae]XP_035681145.1 ribosomal RNA-processing protein 8-like [Branchiostoma floridae]
MAMFGASDWGDDDDAAHLAESLFASGDGLSSFTKHKRKSVKSQEVIQQGGKQETLELKKEDPTINTEQSNGSSTVPHKPKRKRTRKKKPHLQSDLSAGGTEISFKPQLTLKQKRKLKRKRQEESSVGEVTSTSTKKARKSSTQQRDGVDQTDNSTDAGPVRVKKPSFKKETAKDSKTSPSHTTEVPETNRKRRATEVPPVETPKDAENETDDNEDTTGQSDSQGSQEAAKKGRKKQKKKKNRNKNKFKPADGDKSTIPNEEHSKICVSVQNSTESHGGTKTSRPSTKKDFLTGKAVSVPKEQGKEVILKVGNKTGIGGNTPQQDAKEGKIETSPSTKPLKTKKNSPFAKLQKVLQNMRPKQDAEKSHPSFPEPNILHLVNMSHEEDSGKTGKLEGDTDIKAGSKNKSTAEMATGRKMKNQSGDDDANITTKQAPSKMSGDSLKKDTKGGAPDRSSILRQKMEARLKSARFRQINEMLYTTTGEEARRMFQKDPGAFQVYHQGFSAQVQKWPVNPVDKIITWLRRRPASEVVADFGCGDAKVARSVKNRVHSFDLVAVNKHVTVCDITKVPLDDETVDVAVFCLALMGTNISDFLREANRVLKLGGILKIAEVASRFENVNGFIRGLALFGFKIASKDLSNSHFVMFEFTKISEPKTSRGSSGLELRPCLYKKR